MTDPVGFGLTPLGAGPYGYGTPAEAPAAGGAVNGVSDGTVYGARAISTDADTRGQYVFAANGRQVGMPPIEQMVYLAARTVRGSSADGGLGQTFGDARVISENFATEQRARVESAFAHLVKPGWVRIDSVTVQEQPGGRTVTVVKLADLTSKTPIEVTV